MLEAFFRCDRGRSEGSVCHAVDVTEDSRNGFVQIAMASEVKKLLGTADGSLAGRLRTSWRLSGRGRR